MQITRTNEFSLRSNVSGIIALFLLAIVFRLYIVIEHDVLKTFSAQVIHGSLADLAIPFAVLFLATFMSKEIYFKVSFHTTHLFTILTAIDFFHFLKFGSRITRGLLLNNTLLNWLRQDRTFFLPMLFGIWLCYYLIRKLTTGCQYRGSRHNGVFLFCSLILLMTQVISYKSITTVRSDNWEIFLAHQSFKIKNNLAASSFQCLFKTPVLSEKELRTELLSYQPMFDKFHEQYEENARLAARRKHNNETTKLWLHQGYHNSTIARNSTKAFSEAVNRKYPGVELDINYLDYADRFVVCHDLPAYREMYQQLPDLENYFTILSNSSSHKTIVWLDFKNLDYRNQKQALRKLKQLAEKHKIFKLLMIESNDAFLLRDFSRAGFKTIWSLFYEMADERLQQHDIRAAKALAALSGCQMISLPWQVVDEYARRILAPMPLAVHTVNDIEKIREFDSYQEITVILSDIHDVY